MYQLPEKITISECDEQYSLLNEEIKKNESIELDASNVKQIDTSALQLLVVLLKDKKAECSKVSEELLDRACLLGIDEYFKSAK